MASSSSSSSRSWKYDVFLSFRGEDTRKTFVDHLYSALEQHGILTYKDDVTLDRGDTIGPSLLKAIEESQILVIIFSEKYADSSWCLDELSHIMKCRDSETGQIVMPIFYHVDPSDVRKQKGKYREAFAKHELSGNGRNKVETWKKVLFDASNIAGWEPKHVANGHEAKCIKEIVGSILDKLSSSDSSVEDENLVGMGIRLEQLKSQLRIGSGGVRMVGIWGLGGGGKTTLATSLYKKFSPNFDGCCFLGNIREETQKHGLKGLQEKILSTVFGKKMQVESVELRKDKIKQMLCRRKVLIVLDDVDHLDQLEALAGSLKWFGEGSRVIITTRDQHLLTTHRVAGVSPISLLSSEEAVRLFRKHAHHEDNPVQDYEELSQQIVYYAAGLPLALIVLGSFLYDKDKDEWISTLDRLKDHPEMGIVDKLKISYDGLKPVEKELFLDIACFYRGKVKDDAMEILDACGFHPRIGLKVLIQKALITVSSDGYFDMHDLVQEMGHYIVRGKHPKNPEKHSRLWQKKDIEDICSRNATMEYDKLEAIKCDVSVCSSSFIMLVSKMKKLRFLQVTPFDQSENRYSRRAIMENDNIEDIECPDIERHVHQHRRCSSSLIMLVSKMKKLSTWFDEGEDRYSRIATMENDNIEDIECPVIERHVRQHRHCSSSLFMLVSKMKKLTTWFDEGEDRYSRIATMENDNSKMKKPRFLKVITTLFDEGPSFLSNELRYIHWYGYPASLFPESFQPRMLVVLKLEKSLQKEIWKGWKYLPSLKELELVRASKLVRTPDFGGLPCLQKLTLERCESLEEIHQSLGNHSSLVSVVVRECKKLTRFPTIVRMEKLEILEISGCEALVKFPKIEAKVDSLIELTLVGVGIEVLPSSVGEYCTNLISLKLSWCENLTSIKGNLHALKCLENFILTGCKQFNIQQLILPRCLRKLELSWCRFGKVPNEVGELSSLRELDLKWSSFTKLDFSLSRLTSLKHLDLSMCKNLVELPELPSSLAILKADWCDSLEAIIRDDIPINCKCLCDVSIHGGRSNLQRLIETMLQGISVESGCIRLEVEGLNIARAFETGFFRGERCRMQLPENWYNDFSGFLFCTTSIVYHSTGISMTHMGGSTGIKGDDDKSVVYDWTEKNNDDDGGGGGGGGDDDEDDEKSKCKFTWVGYIPFGSLRNTLWWDQTSTAIEIEFQSHFRLHACGCKLIPKRSESETTSITDSSSSSSFDDVYTCRLNIQHDSKSTLKFYIKEYIFE